MPYYISKLSGLSELFKYVIFSKEVTEQIGSRIRIINPEYRQ